MPLNTFLLLLLVFAAYANLFLQYKRNRKEKKKRIEMPISSEDSYLFGRESQLQQNRRIKEIKEWFKTISKEEKDSLIRDFKSQDK